MSDGAVEHEPTAIVEQSARDELNERLQRGLLHRGGSYLLAAPDGGDWRRGRVGIVRPEGPGEPPRLWLTQAAAVGEELVAPAGLSGDRVLALAMEALPSAQVLEQLEGVMKIPVVAYAPDGERGGPRGRAGSILRELRGTLAYPTEALEAVNPDQAYAHLLGEGEAREFLRTLRKVTPRAAFTRFFALACAILWAQQVFLEGISPTQPLPSQLLAWGATHSGTSALEPWRFLLAGLLHGGLAHLLINVVVLWQVGTFCERLYGNVAFAALTLFAVAGGFLASAAVSPLQVSVGASGGVFGVCGAVLAFMLRRRGALPQTLARREIRVFGVFVLAQFLLTGWMGQALPIDHAGHLGGFTAGFLGGLALAPAMPPADPPSRRHLLAVPILALALGLGAFVVGRLPAVAFQARLVEAGQYLPALRAIELRREALAVIAAGASPERVQSLRDAISRVTILTAASDAAAGSPAVKAATLRLLLAVKLELERAAPTARPIQAASPVALNRAYEELAQALGSAR